MAGKAQKPAAERIDQRQGRARRTVLLDVSMDGTDLTVYDENGNAEVIKPPDPPADVGDYAREAWFAFFRSPVSALFDMDVHGEALRHWARLVHQRAWIWEEWRPAPVVKNRDKHIVTNPLWRTVRELDGEILRYEEQFGMTPLAQMRLGVEFLRGRQMEQDLRAPRRGLTKPTRLTP